MFIKSTLALAALFGLVSASSVHHCSNRIDYDYTCKAEKLDECLVNDIPIYGNNVILINLDNRCEVLKYEQ